MNIHNDETNSIFETTISVPGLKQAIKILQISDSHLCELNEADEDLIRTHMELDIFRVKANVRNSARMFGSTLKAAEVRQADSVVLTGDIMSFPSSANFELVGTELEKLTVPYLYALGNHDWQFMHLEDWNDDIRARCYPKFHRYTQGNPAFQNLVLHGVNLISLDNSNYQITEEQLSFFQAQVERNLPALLFIHIPLYIPSLAPDVYHRWKAPIMLHSEGWTPERMSAWKIREADRATKEFHRLVTQGKSDNLIGIFCGHVHFHHRDMYRKDRYQYVAHPGYDGGYRWIHLTPDVQKKS
ncbi:metallophosphoesterase family protein [Paenibacillus sp. HJGM_3]|uniref:metallophosphoesterase family protein n=1 Tax=Paenibacillus sp. HJGM_3 TaxID=3379816 RepID=UPI00385B0861